MQVKVDDLKTTLAHISQGGGAKSCERHISRGKLLPRERVEGLLGPWVTVPRIVGISGP